MNHCYNVALKMPSNYALMNAEEMTHVEGGTSTVYRADEAILYLSRQAALCTTNTLGGLVVAGVGASTVIIGIAGAAIATFMGQWASAYSTALTNLKNYCKQYNSEYWLVGIDEEISWGWLTVNKHRSI